MENPIVYQELLMSDFFMLISDEKAVQELLSHHQTMNVSYKIWTKNYKQRIDKINSMLSSDDNETNQENMHTTILKKFVLS